MEDNKAVVSTVSKRKLSEDSSEDATVKKCRPSSSSPAADTCVEPPSLLNLSDDVLLFILNNLSHRDIKALSFCCRRLSGVCSDRSLWRKVDLRSHRTNAKSFRYYLRYLQSYTVSLAVRGLEGRRIRCDDGPKSPTVLDITGIATGAHINLPVAECQSTPETPPTEPDPGTVVQVYYNERDPQGESREEGALRNLNMQELLTNALPNPLPNLRRSYVVRLPVRPGDNESVARSVYWNPTSQKMRVISCHPGYRLSINPTATASQSSPSGSEQPEKENSNSSPKPFSPTYDEPPSPGEEMIAARSVLEKTEKSLITKEVMKLIINRCPALTVLKLEYCFIDCNIIKVTDFPPQLKIFSMRGSNLVNLPSNRSYLFKMEFHMPDLIELDLSQCHWVTTHSFMSLSKLPSLERLNLSSCRELEEFVAYASLSAQYGFKTLKVLDMRNTGVAHAELSALGGLQTLEELYLKAPTDDQVSETTNDSLLDPDDDGTIKDWEINEPCAIIQEIEDEEELEKYKTKSSAESVKTNDDVTNPPMRNSSHVFVVRIHQERMDIQQDLPNNAQPIEMHRIFEQLYGAPRPAMRTLNSEQFITDATIIRLGKNIKILHCTGYTTITNRSLHHMATSAPALRYLDLTDTGITSAGIKTFNDTRPEVKVIAKHLEQLV